MNKGLLQIAEGFAMVAEGYRKMASEDSYFYDYNAVKAAKVKIDELFK